MIGRTVAPRQNLQSTSTETEHESNFKISTLQTIRNINHKIHFGAPFKSNQSMSRIQTNSKLNRVYTYYRYTSWYMFACNICLFLNRGCACAGLPYLKQNQCFCVSVCPRMGRHLHKQMSTSPTRSVCTHV